MAKGRTLGSGWCLRRTVAKRMGTTPLFPKVAQTPECVGYGGGGRGGGAVSQKTSRSKRRDDV